MTLPVALSGHDVIGQAKTGTGKTLGFGLPIIDRVRVSADVDAGRCTAADLPSTPQALVVVPTRELCTQVTNDLQTAGKVRNVRVLAIYGGRAYEPQVEALQKGVDVVVGTPGRLLDLARQKKLDLSAVRILVLDEADEMLDLGFLPDVEKIMTMLPTKRQAMLFSATMPGQVISLARRYMTQPTHIRATAPDDTGATVASVKQHVFRAHSLDKVELVSRILQSEGRGLAMIFCRTKRTAADVADQLTQRGFAAGAVHGDLGQGAREQALRAFRNGKVDVLVCTDVAARGIDVEGVTHVMNYQCPEDEKTYLHRIGRTGRAGASGTAVTLVDWDDIPRWALINKALDLGLTEPEETYSTSPHLYELLNIAPGTKGVLPRADRTRAGLGAEDIEDLGEPGARGRSGGRDSKPAERGSGSGRSRGAGSGDGRRPAGTSGPVTEAPSEERPRRERQRRRTRNGDGGAPLVEVDAETLAAATAPAAGLAPVTEAEDAAPRRRRRRGGAASELAAPFVEAAPVEEAAPAVEASEPIQPTEAPARRRRTRTTAKPLDTVAEAVEVVEAAAVADIAEVAETAETAAPRRRRRSGVAAEAPVAAEVAEAMEDEAPAPRRRTRSTKAVDATPLTEAPSEATTAEAAAPRRRRGSRSAATVETTETVETLVAPTVTAPEATEAPAPRQRRRAARPEGAAASVPTPAEVPAPRQRRAPAAAAAATEAVAEVPRRRRRSERLADAAAATAAAEARGTR
ncbi:DEAD/DEAH box helicase [Streptacidiphilus sp. MAP12-16]|uniref:DEAD/DEAH box helicase n=1 Tax=Streptacidiphilus sp. MAP12-16 TaxID=3156300 RepID=UPI003516E722